jgi:tripeptidyl-peptidase-2
VKKQAQLLSEAQSRLAEYVKKNDKVDESEKAELEARIEGLKDLDKNYEDPGAILDCVVFFDGKDWRAVIDVNETGDLRGKERKLLLEMVTKADFRSTLPDGLP